MLRTSLSWLIKGIAAALLLASHAAFAGLEPGLYRSAYEGPGEVVRRADTDEGQVLLRERLSPNLQDARMVSCSNDNSRFYLTLVSGPIPEGADVGPMTVVIGQTCLPVGGMSNRGKEGLIAVSTTIQGRAAATKVAEALKITPHLRVHPGHQFVTSVKAAKPSYVPGEPVTLTMTIQNVGKTAIRFDDGGFDRGHRNNQFSFIAYGPDHRAAPDTGDPTNFGGLIQMVTLVPGKTFTKDVDLSGWFKLTAPGTYRITAIYQMPIGDTPEGFTIASPEWEDFAIATCSVHIVEKKP